MTDKIGHGDEAERKYKVWLRAETVGLVAVILIVWGLLILPVVIYFLPVETHYNNTSNNETLSQESTCALPITYKGMICREELLSLKRCYTGDASNYLAVAIDDYLEDAEQALRYVDLIATSECATEVKPFLCLYFFGLCDSTTKISYQPSASQCRNLRDSVCTQEWSIAVNFGLELPDCDVDFPSESVPCKDKEEEIDDTGNFFSASGNSFSASGYGDSFLTTVEQLPTSLEHQSFECSNITCQEGFYCVADIGCNPSCASWKQYPQSTNALIDSLLLMSTCIGIICAVGVLIVTGLRWKKVLTFPSSFVVYQTITVLVSGIFVLVSYMDNGALYCTSENLYLSLAQSSPFCVIAGVTFYYCSFQLSMFWLCHVLAIFWGLKFPFHARAFQTARRTKYVHITCVIISMLFPVIPVVATMIKYSHGKSFGEATKGGLGFGIVRFPPIFCQGRDKDTVFYTLILPIVVILLVGMTVLILIFWIIHKQHGLFQARQSKNPHKIGTAERKILIVFVYYVLLAVFAVLGFSLATRDVQRFTTEVTRYFECERKGMDPDNICDASGYQNLPNITIASLSYILIGMYPLFNFIYVIDVRVLKQHLKKRFPCMFKRSALQRTSTTSTGTKVKITHTSSIGSTIGMLSLSNHHEDV